MTREEAARYWIARYEAAKNWDDPHWEASERKAHRRYVDALKAAIEALSADAVHKPDYSYEADMVRRLKEALLADAEDRLYIKIYADDEPSVKAEKLYQICGETQNREVAEWLKEYFPSAEAVHGEWEEKGGKLVCSVCGNSVSFSQTPKGWVLGKFCQSCGVRMDGKA